MTRREKFSQIGSLTVLSLLLLNPLVTCAIGSSGKTLFFDDFLGDDIDTQKWVAFSYDGSITVFDSYVYLSCGYGYFPWVYSNVNPFPTTGDFTIEFDLTYDKVAISGNGFAICDENLGYMLGIICHVWQDMGGLSVSLLGEHYYAGGIDKVRHEYKLVYSEGNYTMYMDSIELLSVSSPKVPNMIWFGHAPPWLIQPYPWYTGPLPSWSEFKIDRVIVSEPSIEAAINIEPDTLNLKREGKWITCYIELPEDYDVADIDVSTIMLNDQVPAESRPTAIADYDGDSIAELMVKFSRSAVQNILPAEGEAEITVAGELDDGTLFEGKDTIRIIDEGK